MQMPKLIFTLLTLLLTSAAVFAQAEKQPTNQVFRANRDQIKMAQKMLKVPDTGKVDPATRSALKEFQAEKEIAVTGNFNRITLEKLGIGLTTAQREMPVSPETTEPTKTETNTGANKNKPKRTIFRATKEQVMQAQKMLKENSYYEGEENGALDAATRAGLKKFQAANDLLATGALDRETLEKMGIELSEEQKGAQ